jgi:hypothetical protein
MTKASDPNVRSLSDLFADKFVRDAFKRAERDGTGSEPERRSNLIIDTLTNASGDQARSKRGGVLIRQCVQKLQGWRRSTRRLLAQARLNRP